MRICWIPWRSREYASARLRCFLHHDNLLRGRRHTSVIGYDPSADFLVSQQAVDPETINRMYDFRGRVVFDFNDDYSMFDRGGFAKAVARSDLVTVDTEGRREDFVRRYGRACVALENAIDYDLATPHQPTQINRSCAWFGNYLNSKSIRWQAMYLSSMGFRVALITGPGAAANQDALLAMTSYLSGIIPQPYVVVPWRRESFVSDLRRSHFCFLSHRSIGENTKSNTKMVTAVASGVPCLVSDSRGYEELAKMFGLDWSVVRDEASIKAAVDRLKTASLKKEYLKRIQPYVMEFYNPMRMTNEFVRVLDSL